MKLDVQRTKVIVINVVVTFFQGALAAWAVTGNQTTKEAVVGAVAAGASVVWNVVVKPLLKANTELYK